MVERTLVDLYIDVCKELSLKDSECRRFWFAISSEIERVEADLSDPEHATEEDIDAVCERLRVPAVRELAVRAQRPPSIRTKQRRPAVPEAPFEDPRDLLVRHWHDVERLVSESRKVLRLSEEIADTVESRVKEKLFADDCEIVRRFRHQSSFYSYLKVIVLRTFADVRVERSGKWHHSAAAQRLGPLAMSLEKLVYHDGYTVSEAISTLLTWHPSATRAELENLFASLPTRQCRASEIAADGSIQSVAGTNPDVLDWSGEHGRVSRTVAVVIERFIENLGDTDALFLQFLFEDNLPVSSIASILNTDQKSLYRRRDELFTDLRKALQRAGITRSDAAELYDSIAKNARFRFAKKGR